MVDTFTPEQVESFRRDGFLIVEEGLVSERGLELLRERYVPIFDGEYETSIRPEEMSWVPGRETERSSSATRGSRTTSPRRRCSPNGRAGPPSCRAD
jgi:hypothetical protein